MSVQRTSDVALKATKLISKTSDAASKATRAIAKPKRTSSKPSLKPSQTALGPKRNRGPDHEHGKDIYVYNHLQKNMIIYSLTKALRNNAALAQMPFNGKKTVPAALRKDLWHPFAQISFPPGQGLVGLSAFQKLREYRRRHELEWGDEIFYEKGSKTKKLKKNIRGRLICDQKANSVADMAAVLSRLALPEKEDSEKEEPEKKLVKKIWLAPLPIGLREEGKGVRVDVLWRDVTDAEFAETWGDNVEHGVLPMHTNHRKKRVTAPVVEIAEPEGEAVAEGEELAPVPENQSGKVIL